MKSQRLNTNPHLLLPTHIRPLAVTAYPSISAAVIPGRSPAYLQQAPHFIALTLSKNDSIYLIHTTDRPGTFFNELRQVNGITETLKITVHSHETIGF